MREIIFLIFTYLIGSIPFGFVMAYLVKGIDIRKFGSGNIGATNVVRVVGKKWGILVFVLDFLKGFLPLLLAKFILNPTNLIYIVSAILSVSGHNWPIFLKFKGGKGVATTLGVLLGLTVQIPSLKLILGLAILTWAVTFLIARIVSVASVAAAISLPVLTIAFKQSLTLIVLNSVLCIFGVLRHRSNLKRFFRGEERRLF